MVERNGAVLECFGGGTVTASRIHYAMPRGFVAGALCWLAVSLFERCTRSVHKVLREDRLEVLVLFVRIHRLFPEVPSEKKKHNDECRDRVGKLLMNKGAQRVESYFERARVREEKEKQQRVQDPRQSWRMHRHQREKQMLKWLRQTHSQRRGKQLTRCMPTCFVCKSEDQAARDLLQSVPCRQSKVSRYHQKYRKTGGTPSKTWRSVN